MVLWLHRRRIGGVSFRLPMFALLENVVRAPDEDENESAQEQSDRAKQHEVLPARLFPTLFRFTGCGFG